ncbi:MAG: DNA polymerase III subunit gamma/tau [bacterium]
MSSKTTQQTTTSQTHHSSLYRIYRPANFSEVIGQEHIVSVLQDSIKSGKVAHAYLFCGGRGTGKTSVARIFARELGTTDKDLYEIDAASNTSVDDIRTLNESVHTMPFDSAYKVYILDEVHMLSKSAFNAFLKTLEEPPKHVIFILATTEMHKLPETVISRCQTFQFKKPNVEVLKKISIDIAKKEGITIDDEVGSLLALLGDGSFRDTLSVLQKVLSLAGDDKKEISLAEVEQITGAPKSVTVGSFARGIITGDAPLALAQLDAVRENGGDVKLFTELVLESVRKTLLMSMSSGSVRAPGEPIAFDQEKGSATDAERLAMKSPKKISLILERLLIAHGRLGKSAIPTLPLEMVVAECLE